MKETNDHQDVFMELEDKVQGLEEFQALMQSGLEVYKHVKQSKSAKKEDRKSAVNTDQNIYNTKEEIDSDSSETLLKKSRYMQNTISRQQRFQNEPRRRSKQVEPPRQINKRRVEAK